MKPTKFLSCLTPIFCVLTASTVHAADLYWDGGASTVNSQSDNATTTAQTWLSGVTGGNWDNGTASAQVATWTSGDSAIFGGSAASQIITAAGTLNVGNLTFGQGPLAAGTTGTAYTITGGTLALSNSTITTNTDTTISSTISGTTGLTKAGDGVLTLSGATTNTYTGTNTISAGTLKLNLASRTDTTNYIRVNAAIAGTLELNNSNSSMDNVTGVIGYNATSASTITGSGIINKTGDGRINFFSTANLSGFNGTINVTGGTLGSNGGNWGVGTATLNVGTNFDVRTGTVSVNRLLGSGTIGVSHTTGGTLNVGGSDGSSTFDGVLQNGGSALTLTKSGAGTLTLTNVSTYTGFTIVDGGTLAVTTGGSISNGANGIHVRNGSTSTGGLSVTGGSVNSNQLVIGGVAGKAGLVTLSSGSMNLSGGGTNMFLGSDTTTNDLKANAAFTQTGGTFTTNGSIFMGNSATTNVMTLSGGTFTQSAGTTYVGIYAGNNSTLTVSGGTASLQTLNFYGGTGTVNLNSGTLQANAISRNVGTATFNFNGGTLKAGAAFTTATGISTVVKSGGAIIDTNANNVTISTALTTDGTGGGLIKKSGGILTLSGTNTYTGATSVEGGTLKLATGSSIASTPTITIASGATLDVTSLASSSLTLGGTQAIQGSGSVSGTVITGASTSTIAPGMSPGTLTVSALNAANGGTFNFELGSVSDQLAITGALTGSTNAGDLNFNFSDAGGLTAGTTYTLFTFGSQSGFSETDLDALALPSGWSLDNSFDGNGWKINSNSLQVQFVPEPGAALLGGLGLLALLRRRR